MSSDRLVEDLLMLYHTIRRATHPVHRAEITPEQHWLLRLLRHRGSLSIGEVAEVLGVTGSSATTACKRLEKAGLLTRERQSDDERMVRVLLTPEGHKQIELWQQQRRAFLTQLLAPLTEQDQVELQRLLETMLEHIEQPVSLFSKQRITDARDDHH